METASITNQWDGEIYKNNSRLQRYFGSMIIDKYIVPHEIALNRGVECDKIGLDIGCGDGFLTNEISNKMNCRMDGIDISNSMITIAKTRQNENKNLLFFEQDITAISSLDKYSFITSFFCLQWIMNQESVYRNIASLLNDGGYGYLFVSPKKPSNKLTYIDIIRKLLTNDKYSLYFSEFRMDRFDLTKENFQYYIEKGGLVVDDLIEVNEPFIFENKKELSSFFHCIVFSNLVIKENIQVSKSQLVTELCDDLIDELVKQGNYELVDGGLISKQGLLFAIVHKCS